MVDDPKMPRGVSYCFGWHCLSPAQHFGIIFSVIVVILFLAVLWMCYLGKLATLKKQRGSVSLPGGRRVPRTSIVNAEVIPLGQLSNPPAHAIPHQPVYGNTFIPFPQAQPYVLTHQQLPRPPTPMPYLSGPVMSGGLIVQGSAVEMDAGPRTTRSQNCNHESDRRSWRHRLGAMLRMPMGRASTISSTNSVRSCHQNTLGASDNRTPRSASSRQKSFPRSDSFNDRNIHQQPTSPSIRLVEQETTLHSHGERDGEISATQSLHTDAATVRSDDYYMAKDSNAGKRSRKANVPSDRPQGSQPPLFMQDTGARKHPYADDNDMISVPSVSSVSLGRAPTCLSDSGRLVLGRMIQGCVNAFLLVF